MFQFTLPVLFSIIKYILEMGSMFFSISADDWINVKFLVKRTKKLAHQNDR